MPPNSTKEPVWAVRNGNEADCRSLAPRLTKGSREEIAALTPFQPLSVLLLDHSRKGVIYAKGKAARPVAMLDTSTIDPTKREAAIWAALTDDIVASEWFWSMTNYTNDLLNAVQPSGVTLKTFVDARNIRHRLWLDRLGFNVIEELPEYGLKALPFLLMARSKP